MAQTQDRERIAEVIATWMEATAAGDLEKILNLMTEDVVFLMPGQEPMRGREAFAAGFRAAIQHFRIEGSSEIQEIQVEGNLAYCWNHLTITLIPLQEGDPKVRQGPVLSVFRKDPDGTWRIFRDANMLAAGNSELEIPGLNVVLKRRATDWQ